MLQRGTGTLTYKQIVGRSFGTSISSGFFKFMITEWYKWMWLRHPQPLANYLLPRGTTSTRSKDNNGFLLLYSSIIFFLNSCYYIIFCWTVGQVFRTFRKQNCLRVYTCSTFRGLCACSLFEDRFVVTKAESVIM